jgi:hypothetical protein
LPQPEEDTPGKSTPSFDLAIRNPIDAFIQQRLRDTDFDPNSSAEPRTLVRRLSFDLTGLPPSADEVQQFARDPSYDNYLQLVESKLNSPHFGERMAIHWLDLVRYADTLGYHGDQERSVSPYRDYVIQAFNDNKPFDRFTLEQLAGDLLPDADLTTRVASTYNRLNRASGEGGVQPKEYLAKYSADRVRTTGSVWLGSTLGCAECHDHKFDPFTTKDFYRFAAFFADIKEQGIVSGANHIEQLPVPTEEQQRRKHRLEVALKNATQDFERQSEELQEAQSSWEVRRRSVVDDWFTLSPLQVTSSGEASLNLQPDASILASGKNPGTDTYSVQAEVDASVLPVSAPLPQPQRAGSTDSSDEQASADKVKDAAHNQSDDRPSSLYLTLRLELLPDESLPKQGPGRAGNGNLVITDVRAKLAGRAVDWTSAGASHSQDNHSPEHILTGDKNGWAILPEVGQAQQLVLSGQLSGPLPQSTGPVSDEDSEHAVEHEQAGKVSATRSSDDAEPLPLEIEIVHDFGNGHNTGRFRLHAQFSEHTVDASTRIPSEIDDWIAIPVEDRSAEQQRQIEAAFRQQTDLLQPERERIAKLNKELEELQQQIVTTLATTATEPRTIRVLPRGNWMDDSGEIVKPAVPQFLPQSIEEKDVEDSSARLTRLDLARWMVSRQNPLVARTFVNRMWMLMFGHGLSRSVDDLGSQGELPTHPELLDWLSAEFIDSGWNIKHLLRMMVTSHTYCQSSLATAELRSADPYNRLYARQTNWRLEAEMIRDNILATSGLLDERLGGQSAKPYQPAGYWGQLNFPKRTYQHDEGPDQYRRGVYTHWQRTFLHPSMLAFDAPAREECTARRTRSNTPLQSLVLLNDPSYVEAARVLAGRVIEFPEADFRARLDWLIDHTLQRAPREDEYELLGELYDENFSEFQESPAAAKELSAIGLAPVRTGVEDRERAAELAAWTMVCRSIFNLHEFITRY